LCLTVSPGGTRTWNVFYTKPGDGKRARMKIGRYPETKLAAARTKAQEKRASATDGSDPIAEKKAKAASLTVADLIDDYLVRSKVAQRRSAREVERRLRKNVIDVIGSVKVADLHKRDITRCIDPVVDRGARVEANRLFAELRAMIRWAHGERGAIDTNVMAGMKPPTEEVVRERSLVKEEKGGRYSYEELRRLWDAPRFIFPAPGGRAAMSGGAVAKAVKRQEKNGKTLGIPPWTPHDLRRSVATGMAAIGVPGHVIARVLNHVGIAKAGITDKVYNTYTYQNEMRDALELWAKHLTAVIEGKDRVVTLRAAKA
jgi:integrase